MTTARHATRQPIRALERGFVILFCPIIRQGAHLHQYNIQNGVVRSKHQRTPAQTVTDTWARCSEPDLNAE